MFNKTKIIVSAFAMLASMGAAQAGTISVGEEFETDTAHFTTTKLQECKAQSARAAVAAVIAAEFNDDEMLAMGGALSCKAKEKIRFTLGISSLVLSSTAVGAMCAGVTTPFAAAIAGAGVVVQALDFAADKMECHDDEADARNKALIKQQICEAFVKKGIDCDPSSL